MPIHDWTRVGAGLFHAFHQDWIVDLCRTLNRGGPPADYFALPEQRIHGPVPDVLTLKQSRGSEPRPGTTTGLAVAAVPPRARVIQRIEEEVLYARRADRIVVRHQEGDVVAVIEIVSPGTKASKNELHAFVEKAVALISQGVHLLVVDLFPPSKRDPQGIHRAIWEEFGGEDFTLPPDKPLVVAAYDAGPPPVAYVEPVAVGDLLPSMPLFLRPGFYVPAPLEATYQSSWSFFPAEVKPQLELPPSQA